MHRALVNIYINEGGYVSLIENMHEKGNRKFEELENPDLKNSR